MKKKTIELKKCVSVISGSEQLCDCYSTWHYWMVL